MFELTSVCFVFHVESGVWLSQTLKDTTASPEKANYNRLINYSACLQVNDRLARHTSTVAVNKKLIFCNSI